MADVTGRKQAALAKYRSLASNYDASTTLADEWRRVAVERLDLRPGDVVLDVACGTGINFPGIRAKVGEAGRVVGIEMSPDMASRARQQVAASGWGNVSIVEGTAEDVAIPVTADAVLFSLTHDVLQSPSALENVFRHVRPGGRVVSMGVRWAPWWRLRLNVRTWSLSRGYVTTFSGFGKPWRHLARFAPDLVVESLASGAAYVASGRHRPLPEGDQ